MLREAVDIHGSDLARWPAGAPTADARAALLADRGFRAYWEAAASLDGVLVAVRESMDREIAASGAPERVIRALIGDGAGRRRRWSPRSWTAIAAAFVLAAGLGSFVDFAMVGADGGNYDVVVVDPLAFGTAAVEAQ
jgi:hypothetical protein